MWYNLRTDLSFQVDWRGPILQNLRILVCRSCYDKPQENLRTVVLPADPVPVMNARVQDFAGAETDYRVTAGSRTDPITGLPIPTGAYRVTENGCPRTTTPYGTPTGFDQNAVMPWNGTVKLGVALPILSVIANGTTVINVTCSAPHGLVTGAQIAVNGLSDVTATGFYSVTVTTATAFTYNILYPIAVSAALATDSGFEILADNGESIVTSQPPPPSSLLTSETLITTCLIGLPYGYDQIPQVGPGGLASVYVPSGPTKPRAVLQGGITTDDGSQILADSGQPITVSN